MHLLPYVTKRKFLYLLHKVIERSSIYNIEIWSYFDFWIKDHFSIDEFFVN